MSLVNVIVNVKIQVRKVTLARSETERFPFRFTRHRQPWTTMHACVSLCKYRDTLYSTPSQRRNNKLQYESLSDYQ